MMIDNCYGGDRLTQDTGVSTVTADPKWFSAVNETESEVAVAKSKDSRFGTGTFYDRLQNLYRQRFSQPTHSK